MIQANTKRVSFGKRLLTAAASLVMLATCAVTAMPVHAANTAPTTDLTTTFNKYLVMPADANVPNVTFNFDIAAGTKVDATDSTPAIYAGVGTPTVGSASFTSADETQTGSPADTGEKYAVQEVTVNFTGVSFTAPGIYRYVITEQASSQDGITNDATTTRTLDVYVEYDNEQTQTLAVTHYVLHEGTGNPDTADKSNGFTNSYATQNLTLSKTVTGDQGDRDKYFEFTVNITGAVAGTKYTVDLSDAETTAGGHTNETTLIATDGTVTATYYLKHNQSIVIKGLTEDTQYEITETSYANDGYTTSYVLDSADSVKGNTTGLQTMGDTGHTVVFTNDKDTGGVVPTGLLLDVAPYIVLVAVVVAGLAALMLSKKRRSR